MNLHNMMLVLCAGYVVVNSNAVKNFWNIALTITNPYWFYWSVVTRDLQNISLVMGHTGLRYKFLTPNSKEMVARNKNSICYNRWLYFTRSPQSITIKVYALWWNTLSIKIYIRIKWFGLYILTSSQNYLSAGKHNVHITTKVRKHAVYFI